MSRLQRRDVYAALILAALCVLFFWRIFLSWEAGQVMFPLGDFSYQFYAWRVLIVRELGAGRFPLWTPSIYGGYPLQADPQSALFYPPAMLINLGAVLAGLKPFPFRLLEIEVILHVLLASLFTYAFLRFQLKHWLDALLGAVVFAYGGYLTGYPLLQMSIVESAIWLPLALVGIWQRYQAGKRRALWLTAFALGMSVLAGHAQTSMWILYAILAYLSYQAWRTGAAWRQGLRDALFVLAVAAGLSAVQVLPSWEYLRFSTRASLPVAQAGTGFPLYDVVQFVLTGLVSLWQPLYIGIWPLVLIFFVLAIQDRLHKRGDAIFWLALALVALLLSFGDKLLSFDLCYLLLPGYRFFRGQERLALLVSFGLSVAAAYGAEGFWRAWNRLEHRRARAVLRGLEVACLFSFAALMPVVYLHRQGIDPSDSRDLPTHLSLLCLALAGSLALFLGRFYKGRGRDLWRALALVIVTMNLFASNRPVNQVPLQTAYPLTPPIRLMQADPELFRYQNDDRLPPQSACVFDLQEVQGIAPIRPTHFDRFLSRVPEALRWKLLNVKYVITWRGNLVSREGAIVPADKVYQQGEGKEALHMYRLKEPGPRAWVVRSVYFARDDSELYEYLSAPYFDPLRAAVVREPTSPDSLEALSFPAIVPEGWDEVFIGVNSPMRLWLKVRLAAKGLLVLSEVTYPGWRAYVNGHPVPTYEAYGLLRAVVLPEGESAVEFRYVPLMFYVGAAISAVSLLVLIAGAALSARGGHRRS